MLLFLSLSDEKVKIMNDMYPNSFYIKQYHSPHGEIIRRKSLHKYTLIHRSLFSPSHPKGKGKGASLVHAYSGIIGDKSEMCHELVKLTISSHLVISMNFSFSYSNKTHHLEKLAEERRIKFTVKDLQTSPYLYRHRHRYPSAKKTSPKPHSPPHMACSCSR
jgi:hypothetical protein